MGREEEICVKGIMQWEVEGLKKSQQVIQPRLLR
jgi:hypothetical protein